MLLNVGGGARPKLTGDATAADVIAGKKFYSDDYKTKQSGSLVVPQIDAKGLPRYLSATLYGTMATGASIYSGMKEVHQIWPSHISFTNALSGYSIRLADIKAHRNGSDAQLISVKGTAEAHFPNGYTVSEWSIAISNGRLTFRITNNQITEPMRSFNYKAEFEIYGK